MKAKWQCFTNEVHTASKYPTETRLRPLRLPRPMTRPQLYIFSKSQPADDRPESTLFFAPSRIVRMRSIVLVNCRCMRNILDGRGRLYHRLPMKWSF